MRDCTGCNGYHRQEGEIKGEWERERETEEWASMEIDNDCRERAGRERERRSRVMRGRWLWARLYSSCFSSFLAIVSHCLFLQRELAWLASALKYQFALHSFIRKLTHANWWIMLFHHFHEFLESFARIIANCKYETYLQFFQLPTPSRPWGFLNTLASHYALIYEKT